MKPLDLDGEELSAAKCDFITVWIGDQLFGLPILRVQDVFMPNSVTEVPMALRDVAGVLNLRGRIVTAINMRSRLGLPPFDSDRPVMAVGIESGNESYGLIIDSVGDVVSLDTTTFEESPSNLDPRWSNVSSGVHRLEGQLMVVLDVDRVLGLETEAQAA
jgi:purine-binding chemotaxis protein CheW